METPKATEILSTKYLLRISMVIIPTNSNNVPPLYILRSLLDVSLYYVLHMSDGAVGAVGADYQGAVFYQVSRK